MMILAVCLCLGVLLLLGRDNREVACRDLRIEGLEPRIAPAALVAKFGGGMLTISGDPAAGTVDIIETAGSIEVFDGAVSLGVFEGVKNITGKIQGGAVVTANLTDGGISGSLKLTATGATSFQLTSGSRVDGAFSFKGDTAEQTIVFGSDIVIGRSFSFQGGLGLDAFSVNAGTTIGGSATFVAVEDVDFINNTAISIGKNLVFKNSSTALDVDVQTLAAPALNIAGVLTYVGGTGNDALFIRATLGGNAAFVDRTGNNGFGFGEDSVIRGSVIVTTGSGNDTFGIQAGTVEGNVTLKLGSGNNSFNYGIAGSVTINGNLSMTTGDGNDQWRTSGGGMVLGGNVTMALGDGANQIIASAAVAGTKVTVKLGDGADAVGFDGSAMNARLRFSLGAGSDSLAGVLLRNSVSAFFDGGAGIDHFFENTLTGDPLIIVGFEDLT